MRKELTIMSRYENKLTSGLFRANPVLSACMIISPVVMCGDNLKKAVTMAFVFSFITFISVFVSSFLPKKLPYAIKLMLHAVIGALVYIPVRLFADEFFPEAAAQIGIFFPLTAVNSLIVFHSETKYYTLSKGRMTVSLLLGILGFDAVMLITGIIREIIGYGTVYGRFVDMKITMVGISKPFGGLILLGILCGLFRKIRLIVDKNSNDSGGEADVSVK